MKEYYRSEKEVEDLGKHGEKEFTVVSKTHETIK